MSTDETSRQPPAAEAKLDPATLALRARPRPVTRLNRKVLMALCALGCLLVLGATVLALDPPSFRSQAKTGELYNVANKPTADGLARLPATYGQLPPRLGAPLPGDLGGAVVGVERTLGLNAGDPPMLEPNASFRPDAEQDALRAERIRLARLAQKARESGVFFQVAGATNRAEANPPATAPLPDGRMPGDLGAAEALSLNADRDQNRQGQKNAFLARPGDDAIYNAHALEDPVSPYQVMAGTVIAASLITGLNSDLPGLVIAQVTESVRDTVTGRHVLIPQGSRLLGRYDSVVAYGQERALVSWNRIVMPDGASIVIDSAPATDTAGYAGLADDVDVHTWRLLKGIALSTLLGVGTELTFGDDEADLVRAIRRSTQDSANQVGQRITERNLNVQPTITVRPGWPLRVIVHKDLVLRPYHARGDGP